MIMNIAFPLCAVMLTIVFRYKLRYLRSRWSSARVWALSATVFCFAVTMWSAFPASVRVINRVTGVPNVAELEIGSDGSANLASGRRSGRRRGKRPDKG